MAHPAKLTGEAANKWFDKAGKKDWGQY